MAYYTDSDEEGVDRNVEQEDEEEEEAAEFTPRVKSIRKKNQTKEVLKSYLVSDNRYDTLITVIPSTSKIIKPLDLVPHFLGDEGGEPSEKLLRSVKKKKKNPSGVKALDFSTVSQLDETEKEIYTTGVRQRVVKVKEPVVLDKDEIRMRNPKRAGRKETFLGDIRTTAFADLGTINLISEPRLPNKDIEIEEERRNRKEVTYKGQKPITSRGFTEDQVNLNRPLLPIQVQRNQPLNQQQQKKTINKPSPVTSKFPRLEMVAESDWEEKFHSLAAIG